MDPLLLEHTSSGSLSYALLEEHCWSSVVAPVYSRGSSSAEHLLFQRQLRWVGHVIRMPTTAFHDVFFKESFLLNGQRTVGRPELRFKDLNRILRCCHITYSDLKAAAGDRYTSFWKTGIGELATRRHM